MATESSRRHYRTTRLRLRAAMATLRDSLGLITSTDDPLSLERFEQALASLFRADGNALPTIERAIAAIRHSPPDTACAPGRSC